MSDKKKFKDTKLGSFLIKNFPKAKDLIGDLLPDNGVLGIVKNLVSKDKEVSPEIREETLKMLKEFELEFYKVEVEDRKSARSREVEIAKTGSSDWLMYATGVTGLGTFAVLVYSILFRELPENALLHQLIGMIEGVALTIFAYFFGTSKSSSDKNKLIK
jgi:hypothetical protein